MTGSGVRHARPDRPSCRCPLVSRETGPRGALQLTLTEWECHLRPAGPSSPCRPSWVISPATPPARRVVAALIRSSRSDLDNRPSARIHMVRAGCSWARAVRPRRPWRNGVVSQCSRRGPLMQRGQVRPGTFGDGANEKGPFHVKRPHSELPGLRSRLQHPGPRSHRRPRGRPRRRCWWGRRSSPSPRSSEPRTLSPTEER